MFPDTPIWEWKLGEVSLLGSALLIVIARPIWLLLKLLIYSVWARISSWRWVVRCCVRLWMWTNWDIGTALFGMARDSWGVHTGSMSALPMEVTVAIEHSKDNGDRESAGSHILDFSNPYNTFNIDAEDALNQTSTNIDRLDKRRWYRHLFLSELKSSMQSTNIRKLQKQARRMK